MKVAKFAILSRQVVAWLAVFACSGAMYCSRVVEPAITVIYGLTGALLPF